MNRLRDGWRLAVGTFTAVPVSAPRTVDSRTSVLALMLAPLAVVPLAIGAGIVVVVGREFSLAPFAVAALVIGFLALGSRAFHLDGLADTADGLTASYDRERSLAVMKTGDVGPAGVVAIVVVLLIQVGALASVLLTVAGPAKTAGAVAIVVMASRCAPALVALRGIPNASTGIGATFVGSVRWPVAMIALATLIGLLVGATLLLGLPWWRGWIAAAVVILVVAVLVRRAVTRLGGVVGDIFGASIEISLALMLLVLS